MKSLAQKYGFTEEDVQKMLKEFVDEIKEKGNIKSLERCYDCHSGKYLSFEEWVDYNIVRLNLE